MTPFAGLTGFGGGPTGLALGGAAGGTGLWTGSRGVFIGGWESGNNTVSYDMDYFTIATTGNGQDWGDLPDPNGSYAYAAGLSDSHGGI